MVKDLFGLVGQTLGDKYHIENLVAAGGFGVVYRARHTELQTLVAIKVLHVGREADAQARSRFLEGFREEARVVARVDHPAIVRVLDFGVSPMPDGERAPWMVLEWVEGRTLKADLKERRGQGGRSPRECLALLRPVLEALAQAHEDGVVHRDLKPANMILTATVGAEGKARRAHAVPMRLLDFGIAKIMQPDEAIGTGETSTSAAALQFTRAYAAPEQFAGKRTGPWTDVHALGLVLTEMLTDQPAWRGEDPVDLLRQVVALGRPTPRRAGVDVGPWEAVLARAMAVVPAERFAHAGDLLAALEADVPVEARRCEEDMENSALAVSTQVTAITSTTAPSVSAAPPLASRSAEPVRWYARPRARYAVPGVLGVALLGAVALVGSRGAPVTAQRRNEQVTVAVAAPADVTPISQEARTLAAPPRMDAELRSASHPDAGVQVISVRSGGGRPRRSASAQRLVRDGGARGAPIASVTVTPSVVPERDPSPPSPRRLSETLPPP